METKTSLSRTAVVCISICILVLTLISSCTTPEISAPVTKTTATSTTPQRGGILTIETTQMVVNIGDPIATGSPNDLFCNMPAVECLVRYDASGLPSPWLSTGWQISADGKQITMTLRKGVKFHDGTDFNAEAVKFNLDRYRNSKQVALKEVTSVDIVDDYAVRLNLSGYQDTILNSLGASGRRSGWMISPKSITTNGENWLISNVVGTGPFKLKSYKQDVSLTFERFDGYWQKDKPYLDGIQINFIADATVALMNFQRKEALVHAFLTVQDVAVLKKEGKYNIAQSMSSSLVLAGNSATANSPFADVNVRRAVSYAIDNKTLAQTLGANLIVELNQVYTKESWAYNPTIAGYPYNPAKAKELLTKAGYEQGFQTKFTYLNTFREDIMLAIQAYLDKVGIKVTVEPVQTQRYAQIQSGGWDGLLALALSGSIVAHPSNTLQTITTRSAVNKSIKYPADYENNVFNSIAEPDAAKRKALLQTAMKLAIDEYCIINPVYGNLVFAASYPDVHNARIRELSVIPWTPEDAWLEKK